MKDTNILLKKLIDAVGLYPIIPRKERLEVIWQCDLKQNAFKHNKR